MRSEIGTATVCFAMWLTACESSRPKSKVSKNHDPTAEAWYQTATQELTELDRKAEQLYAAHNPDAASALIEHGESLSARLLAVPRPTLAAAEGAADLDQLYGRMLFGNRHYGWARLQFQKNLARWKRWQPSSPETARRLNQAQRWIEDCDRKIERGS